MNYRRKKTLSSILIFFVIIQLLVPKLYVYAQNKENNFILVEVEKDIEKEENYYIIEESRKEINLNIILKDKIVEEISEYELEFEYDSNKIINIEKQKIEDNYNINKNRLNYNITSNQENIASIKLILNEELETGDIFSFTIKNISEDEILYNEDIIINFKIKDLEKNNEINRGEFEENIYTENSSIVKENFNTIENIGKTISDGTYTILSALNQNKVIDVSGGSKEIGANIQIWDKDDVEQQIFDVKYLENGYYTITASHSSKVLDVEAAGKMNGTNVQQYESNGTDAQKWIIKEADNGYYYIISKCNGLYLDVKNGKSENGTNIQMYEGNRTKAQKFKFVKYEPEPLVGKKTIEDGLYNIKLALDDNKVIDIDSASKKDGANVQIWEEDYVAQQRFLVKHLGDGYYTIQASHSSKVLDVLGASKEVGANVQQYESNGTDAQKWIIKEAGDGYYYIISKCNGLYLNVENNLTKNGTNINMYKKNNSKAQKFRFVLYEEVKGSNSIESGNYVISTKINNNYVLDVSEASKKDGANIQLWSNANVKQQRFNVNYLGEGYFTIKANHSSKVLDVVDSGKKNGTNVQQYESNGTDGQKWIIKEAGEGYYYIISKINGKYLDACAGKAYNGNNIQVYEKNDTNAQKFKFTKVIEYNGIDVSQYQGTINWNKVANSGVDFAIMRIGLRGYRNANLKFDSMFEKNYKAANENGIDIGVYFVTQALNYNEGVEEANFIIPTLKKCNISYPVVIDVEWAGGDEGNNGRADYLSKEERTNAINGFCDTIRNAGYIPMVYANKYWLKDHMNVTDLRADIWLAHYVKGAPDNKSDYKGSYEMWQYTSSGRVDGINGNVDLNICYKKY